jgi:tRNA (guanine37-N1)-methyltransferase
MAPPAEAAFRARVLTLLPEAFPGPLGLSLAGTALQAGIWSLVVTDIRDHAGNRHRNVDDTPFGGGPGMVMRPDVLARALDAALAAGGDVAAGQPKVYFSPRGRQFDQSFAREIVAAGGVTMVCGRFEGVDERLIEARGLTEVSLGDIVLSGGEIAAFAMLDAAVRLLPGVMGKAASLEQESFADGLLEYPQYTRPREWEGRAVPSVLLSGDHARIDAWRRAEAERVTARRRPDLWAAYRARSTTPARS